jgi:hypothetical protein
MCCSSSERGREWAALSVAIIPLPSIEAVNALPTAIDRGGDLSRFILTVFISPFDFPHLICLNRKRYLCLRENK